MAFIQKSLIDECDQLESSCVKFDKERELFSSNAPNTLEKISTIANGLVSGLIKPLFVTINYILD